MAEAGRDEWIGGLGTGAPSVQSVRSESDTPKNYYLVTAGMGLLFGPYLFQAHDQDLHSPQERTDGCLEEQLDR